MEKPNLKNVAIARLIEIKKAIKKGTVSSQMVSFALDSVIQTLKDAK